VEEAIGFIQRTEAPEYQWMFILVGYVKGHRVGYGVGARAGDFFELAQAFGREVVCRLTSSFAEKVVDWSDEGAVCLEFERAWASRQHVKDSGFFQKAVDISLEEPLDLGPKVNPWVRRLVNAGFVLQELKPDVPFLLPINPDTAQLFGTTMRTLSLALQKAIGLGLIRVEQEARNNGTRYARRLAFNYEHPVVAARLEKAREALRDHLRLTTD
jgi:hypothetical protein